MMRRQCRAALAGRLLGPSGGWLDLFYTMLLRTTSVVQRRNTPSTSSAPDFVNAVRLGGDTTQENTSQSSHAFSSPAANLTPEQLDLHNTGDANFEQAFITAPSTDFPNLDGLGPVFNNSHCEGCHQRDGRGTPPIANGVQFENFSANESMLLRISLAGSGGADCEPLPDNNYCAPTAVPGFGTQLFNRGVLNARTDANFTDVAKVAVRYLSHQVTLNGGEVITLRAPEFQISSPYDAPDEPLTGVTPSSRLLQSDVRISARVGSPVFGLGLIEAISAADILANADPDDSNGDGISGRANYVFDPSAGPSDAPVALGRFGWKANTPSIYVQALCSLHNCMGVTHVMFTTGKHQDGYAELSNLKIWPFSDFLLHDMGTGLADQRTDFLADGNEWRKPPLWGIGLTKTVNPLAGFLHDGRARTLTEAILWHGGEGQSSRDAFAALLPAERAALLSFLGSL